VLIWIHPNLSVVFCFRKWLEIARFSGPFFFPGPPLMRSFGASRNSGEGEGLASVVTNPRFFSLRLRFQGCECCNGFEGCYP